MLDLDTKIDFHTWTKSTELLDDDPEEPKTLTEIHAEVGFPFRAKAVIYPGTIERTTIPVGDTLTFIGRCSHVGEEHPIYGNLIGTGPRSIGRFWCRENNKRINGDLKRWILVK
jgi:hypothetical protein